MGLLSLSDQKLRAAGGQLFPVSRHLLARYIRPPGHSTGKRQLSSVPTWQPQSPDLNQEFPFHSWKSVLPEDSRVRQKGSQRKGAFLRDSKTLLGA